MSSTATPFGALYAKPLPDVRSWVTPGVLPKGGIMLMGGLAKIGKSWLLMDLADCLAEGRPLWGVEAFTVPEPVRVLYVEHEIGPWSMQERIHTKYDALGREPSDRILLVSRQPSIAPTSEFGLRACVDLVRELDVQVVIFDPVGRMLMNDISSHEVGQFFSNVDRLLSEFSGNGLSVVLSHHFTKPPKNDDEREGFDALSAYNFRGSGRWRDAPDTLITLERRPGHGSELWRLNSRWEFRHGAEIADKTLALGADFAVKPASGGVRNRQFAAPEERPGSRNPRLEESIRQILQP